VRRIVLTGAMGSGKSTILAELERQGIAVRQEPARIVLAEQRASGGRGVPEHDAALFCDLMLDRAIDDFDDASGGIVVFDRGIPDQIAYRKLLGLDAGRAERAAHERRYDDTVFVAPAWPEIYTTDDERKMSAGLAAAFGRDVREIYCELDYTVIDVPLEAPDARAAFILERVRT
jgi:predicted ATPase